MTDPANEARPSGTAQDRARAAIEAEWAERDRMKALRRRLDRFADGGDLGTHWLALVEMGRFGRGAGE